MKIHDIEKAQPSASPPLDVATLLRLPGEPIVHMTPIDRSSVMAPQVEGVRALEHDGDGRRMKCRRWHSFRRFYYEPEAVEYPWPDQIANSDAGFLACERHATAFDSLDELLSSHKVRYIRAPRILCATTGEAVRRREKTVTRRLATNRARFELGDVLNLVDGARRPGVLVLAAVAVVSARRERLSEMSESDLELEGCGGMSLEEFRDMFCRMHSLPARAHDPRVWRVEWVYL